MVIKSAWRQSFLTCSKLRSKYSIPISGAQKSISISTIMGFFCGFLVLMFFSLFHTRHWLRVYSVFICTTSSMRPASRAGTIKFPTLSFLRFSAILWDRSGVDRSRHKHPSHIFISVCWSIWTNKTGQACFNQSWYQNHKTWLWLSTIYTGFHSRSVSTKYCNPTWLSKDIVSLFPFISSKTICSPTAKSEKSHCINLLTYILRSEPSSFLCSREKALFPIFLSIQNAEWYIENL